MKVSNLKIFVSSLLAIFFTIENNNYGASGSPLIPDHEIDLSTMTSTIQRNKYAMILFCRALDNRILGKSTTFDFLTNLEQSNDREDYIGFSFNNVMKYIRQVLQHYDKIITKRPIDESKQFYFRALIWLRRNIKRRTCIPNMKFETLIQGIIDREKKNNVLAKLLKTWFVILPIFKVLHNPALNTIKGWKDLGIEQDRAVQFAHKIGSTGGDVVRDEHELPPCQKIDVYEEFIFHSDHSAFIEEYDCCKEYMLWSVEIAFEFSDQLFGTKINNREKAIPAEQIDLSVLKAEKNPPSIKYHKHIAVLFVLAFQKKNLLPNTDETFIDHVNEIMIFPIRNEPYILRCCTLRFIVDHFFKICERIINEMQQQPGKRKDTIIENPLLKAYYRRLLKWFEITMGPNDKCTDNIIKTIHSLLAKPETEYKLEEIMQDGKKYNFLKPTKEINTLKDLLEFGAEYDKAAVTLLQIAEKGIHAVKPLSWDSQVYEEVIRDIDHTKFEKKYGKNMVELEGIYSKIAQHDGTQSQTTSSRKPANQNLYQVEPLASQSVTLSVGSAQGEQVAHTTILENTPDMSVEEKTAVQQQQPNNGMITYAVQLIGDIGAKIIQPIKSVYKMIVDTTPSH